MKKKSVLNYRNCVYIPVLCFFVVIFAGWAHHAFTTKSVSAESSKEINVIDGLKQPNAKQTTNETAPMETHAPTFPPYDRAFIFDRMEDWLSATRQIVKRSGNDRTALGIVSFLEHSFVPMKPVLDGELRMIDATYYVLEAKFFEEGDGDKEGFSLGFIALQPSDFVADSAWRRHFDPEVRKTLAAHIPMYGGYTAIAVRDDVPLSDISKAIILLHEGGHGKVHDMISLYDSTSTRLWQEMMLARLELGLYKSLGKGAFEKLVNGYVRQFGYVSSEIEEYLQVIKDSFEGEITLAMDLIYGLSLSLEDTMMRRRAFFLQFAFTVFDKDPKTSIRETNEYKE